MTDGESRRQKITEMLRQHNMPISGSELAKRLGVSRQIVVQDIALLRADNKEILSTNKGYVIHNPSQEKGLYKRVFPTNHTTEETLDELYTIVDFGGRILDVFIEHGLYGQLRGDLIIDNRVDAAEFVEHMKRSTDQPLKVLTGGSHYHTVVAASIRNLDLIGEELKRKGYLTFLNE